jgi:hypothetical protein
MRKKFLSSVRLKGASVTQIPAESLNAGTAAVARSFDLAESLSFLKKPNGSS